MTSEGGGPTTAATVTDMPCGAVAQGTHLWRTAAPAATVHERGVAEWHVEMRKKHLAQAVLLALRGTAGAVVRATTAGSPPPTTSTSASTTATAADARAKQPAALTPTELQSIRFELCEGVDADTVAYLTPLLEMCADRAVVYRFAKHLTMSFAHGVVNHALGAALLDICLGIHELVCDVWDQLDAHDPLAIVHQRVAPYRHLIALAREVTVMHALDKNGAQVLRCLEQAVATLSMQCPDGDALLNAVYHHAAAPLLLLMESWVYRGEVCAQALAELPIVTSATPPEVLAELRRGRIGAADDTFMEWVFDQSRLPQFMVPSCDLTLQCGKLAMVMRKAGGGYTPPPAPLRAEKDAFESTISDAWREANIAVVALLREHGLDEFVGFLHKYYLCGAASWIADVIDRCGVKHTCSLSRTPKEINWSDLHNILVAVSDRAAQEHRLQFDVAPSQLFRCLRGKPLFHTELPLMSTLQLTAEVRWPLSLVFPPPVFMQYNFLFRLLFRVKALRTDLLRCARGRRGRKPCDTPIRVVLHVMLSFLTSLETYVSFEVIEPAFSDFQKVLHTTDTVEALVEAQSTFLNKALHLTLAHNEAALKLLEKVFLSVKLFSEAARSDIPLEMVQRFRAQFTERVQELLVAMEAGSAVADGYLLQHLLRRLDFNGHYERQRRAARMREL